MIPHTRSAVAAVSLSSALAFAVAACTATGDPVAGGAAETPVAAESAHEATPRMGTASAALQTGVSTGTITRAPQRPAPVPPPPATGPSIAAAHAPPPEAPAPVIPEPEAAEAAPAEEAPSAAAAPPPAPAPAPEAAAELAGLSAADTEEGRSLFNAFSCGACHVLADAGATGQVGPALDGNAALTRDYVIDIVTNGRGAMPGFGGQMTEEEIALLASYIIQVRK